MSGRLPAHQFRFWLFFGPRPEDAVPRTNGERAKSHHHPYWIALQCTSHPIGQCRSPSRALGSAQKQQGRGGQARGAARDCADRYRRRGAQSDRILRVHQKRNPKMGGVGQAVGNARRIKRRLAARVGQNVSPERRSGRGRYYQPS